MRIVVLGAGAIGSAVGALLVRGGHDVTLVARRDHVDAIRRDGLQVDGYLGRFSLPLPATEVLAQRPDLVLLTVKTQDVTEAIRANLSSLRGVPVVTMQNGVRSDELAAELLPSERLLSSVVTVTATFLSPGCVTLVDRGHLVIGRPFGPRDAETERVARVLADAVPTVVSDNLRGAHWTKLLMNLNNALPALTNRPLREVAEDPFLRRLAIRMMREGLRTVDRAGIPLEDLPGVRVRTIRWLARVPERWSSRLFASRAARLGGSWPVLGSTLQSLRRGKETEIDYLNGEVVSLGRKLGMPTPANAKVVELVHGIEDDGRFLSPGEVQTAMSGTT